VREQLPNLRLLGLESSEWGRDWEVLVQEIDQKIDDYAFELASQDIYIEFTHWPALSKVMVYRSVIGPLKEVDLPLVLTDWESFPVNRFDLKADSWTELFEEISQIRQDQEQATDFIIVFSRRLNKELSFYKKVLFR